MIDRNRIKGSVQQAKGVVKRRFGKATGNRKLELEGRVATTKGQIQSLFGTLKDAIKWK